MKEAIPEPFEEELELRRGVKTRKKMKVKRILMRLL